MLHVRPAVFIKGLKATEIDERVHELNEVAIEGYGSRTRAKMEQMARSSSARN